MKHGQQGNRREGEGVLQQPGIAVQRVDRQRDPPDAEERGEDQQIVAMRNQFEPNHNASPLAARL